MKYLFLDFDGVLNPIHYENMMWKMWKTSDGLIKSKDEYGMIFFDQSITHLRYIIEQTNCEIVISSTWRIQGILAMQEMWLSRNMPGKIIGVTPLLDTRGEEIQHYLNNELGNTKEYAILDDRVILGHKDHFVKTNGYYGLTREDAEQVIKILNNELG